MERASSASIARISPNQVEQLVEYMIEHHTETDAVRIYLQTLIDTGVIKNLIESIIEFNKDQTDAFNKLLTTEQIELELASIQETTRNNAVPAPAPAQSPQTSQESTEGTGTGTGSGRIRKFFRTLFGVCCCCRKRNNNIHQNQKSVNTEIKTVSDDEEELTKL